MMGIPRIDDLLIATSQAVFTFRRGSLNCIHHGFGSYPGISWDEKFVYLAARRDHRIPVIEGAQNILVFDPDFNWVGSIQGLKFVGLHQIYFYDGRLYICNTGIEKIDIIEKETMDRIGIIEKKRDGRSPWRFNYSVSRWDYSMIGRDVNHINSIWIDGGIIYVVEHREGPSKVKYFSETYELLGEVDIGDKCHNVYVEDGKLFVCSSETECIIIRDLSTGKDRIINTSQYAEGFPRGLARTSDRWYIGISQRGTREERHLPEGLGSVLAFDDDFNLIHKIILKNVGQVLDIRAMTGLDRAHNGIPFPAPAHDQGRAIRFLRSTIFIGLPLYKRLVRRSELNQGKP